MTLPLILCTLIALTSGLHFGREFAAEHRKGGLMLIPTLAHAGVSSALIVISVLMDSSSSHMMWMIVAISSLSGLALGALLPARTPAPRRRPTPETTPAQVHAA